MKKYVTLLLIGLMAIPLLVGCSSNDNDKKENETPKTEDKKEESKEKTEVKTDTETNKEEEKTETKSKLSNNWKDNQVQIKGKVFTLPFDLKELNNLGFDFENLGEYIVNPNQAVSGKGVRDADGNYITGVYANLGSKAVDIRKTSMTSIIISKDERTSSNKNLDVVLPGGIKFGDSAEDIKKALGKPTRESKIEKSITIKYRDDAQFSHSVEFSIYNGKLITFTLNVR